MASASGRKTTKGRTSTKGKTNTRSKKSTSGRGKSIQRKEVDYAVVISALTSVGCVITMPLFASLFI